MPAYDASTSLVLLVVAPLAAALAAYLLRDRGMELLAGAVILVVGYANIHLTWNVWQLGPRRYPLGGWGAPLGIDMVADGLACTLLLVTTGLATVVSLYALRYFEPPKRETHSADAMYWPLWYVLWSALNALFLSADVFNLYVMLELLTLAAIGLVALAGGRAAIEAALRYLLAALAGSLFYLAAVAFLYGMYGTLDLESLGAQTEVNATTSAALALMILGLMLKTALFPLHFWLPGAHGSAPAPVSAVLSGLVVKASFYLLLRLWFDVFPREMTVGPGWILMLLGVGAILWGSVQAIIAERLKMLVAYSTVAQLGYLFLLFGLARPEAHAGWRPWCAGLLLAMSHACAKGAMFLAAGIILRVAGNDRIDRLAAVSRRLPITFFAMGVAAISLMGLPPSASFAAKWMLLETSLADGKLWLAVAILLGGLLAAIYLFRVLAAAFERPTSDQMPANFGSLPRGLELLTLVLALVGLSLGVFVAPLMELMQIGSPWTTVAEVTP